MTRTALGAESTAGELSAGLLPAGLLAVGLGALFLLISRLSHRCAGLVGVLVAATVPLCYARAPGAFAAAVPTAAALAVMGLGLAALGVESRRARIGAAAVGLAGLGLGWREPGALVGVSVPAASVALTWALGDRPRAGRAAAVLAAAAAVAAPCLERFAFAGPSRGAGLALDGRWLAAETHPTFDAVVAELGRGLFPWSALLPFALAAMTERPPRTTEGESALRLLSLIGMILSSVASALSLGAPSSQRAALTFGASAVGLWFWDVWRGARVSRLVALSLALLVCLMGLDFLRLGDVRARTFAPTATPAQRRALERDDAHAPALLMTSMALVVAGAALGSWGDPRARTSRARWPRVAAFVGALLGALVLRFGYHPRLGVAASNRPALGVPEERARAASATPLERGAH